MTLGATLVELPIPLALAALPAGALPRRVGGGAPGRVGGEGKIFGSKHAYFRTPLDITRNSKNLPRRFAWGPISSAGPTTIAPHIVVTRNQQA